MKTFLHHILKLNFFFTHSKPRRNRSDSKHEKKIFTIIVLSKLARMESNIPWDMHLCVFDVRADFESSMQQIHILKTHIISLPIVIVKHEKTHYN